ncbi:hypothetical protein VHEMI04453 [[Torrubiella] hemipterigena]|uniref:DSBA-like thioredoxin domain-containing protein n=1 Tax=[Torrubiella] hemipterigena TaxID=1531966 RepID=A0A0A1TDU7_9HYPO|nr:hypothetical protein VHEMI04453 [[Torrubiella] hemipterigena]
MQNDPVFKSCEVTYIPIFLGGLMKACGNTAPINITNKNFWIDRERRLWANMFNIPMKDDIPAGFPIMTLNLMRHLAALRDLDGNQTRMVELIDVLSNELWAKHTEIHKPEVFQPILQRALGATDYAKLVEAVPTKGKSLLMANTDKAFADQAFGLPWLVCTNAKGETQTFWGVDHLGVAASFMGLEKPSAGPWKSVL